VVQSNGDCGREASGRSKKQTHNKGIDRSVGRVLVPPVPSDRGRAASGRANETGPGGPYWTIVIIFARDCDGKRSTMGRDGANSRRMGFFSSQEVAALSRRRGTGCSAIWPGGRSFDVLERLLQLSSSCGQSSRA